MACIELKGCIVQLPDRGLNNAHPVFVLARSEAKGQDKDGVERSVTQRGLAAYENTQRQNRHRKRFRGRGRGTHAQRRENALLGVVGASISTLR
jgi:hypothetical protein